MIKLAIERKAVAIQYTGKKDTKKISKFLRDNFHTRADGKSNFCMREYNGLGIALIEPSFTSEYYDGSVVGKGDYIVKYDDSQYPVVLDFDEFQNLVRKCIKYEVVTEEK